MMINRNDYRSRLTAGVNEIGQLRLGTIEAHGRRHDDAVFKKFIDGEDEEWAKMFKAAGIEAE